MQGVQAEKVSDPHEFRIATAEFKWAQAYHWGWYVEYGHGVI